VVAQLDFAACIEIMWQLFPATTNLAIVIGNSPLEKLWLLSATSLSALHQSPAVHLGERFVLPGNVPSVGQLAARSAIGYGTLLVDAAGVPHEQLKALEQLCALANAPVLGTEEEELGYGIIGGSLTSGRALGLERPGWPPASCAVNRPVASRRQSSAPARRNLIGGNCNAGTLARACCHRAASCDSGSQACGSDIAGTSWLC